MYEIIYNLEWIYEDKRMEGLTKEVEANDALNAAATLQFLIGDSVQVEITSVREVSDCES